MRNRFFVDFVNKLSYSEKKAQFYYGNFTPVISENYPEYGTLDLCVKGPYSCILAIKPSIFKIFRRSLIIRRQ